MEDRAFMQTENPIKKLREDLAISRRDMARLLDMEYPNLASVEYGHFRALPARLRAPLEEMGFSYDELNQAYIAWRQADTAATRQRIRVHRTQSSAAVA